MAMRIRKMVLLVGCFLFFSASVRAESGNITDASWSGDGRYLVTIGEGRRIRVHDAATGLVQNARSVPGEKTTLVSFSPDSAHEETNSIYGLQVCGETAVVGSVDYRICWFELPNLQLLETGQSSYGQRETVAADNGNVVLCLSTSTRYLDTSLQLLRRTPQGLEDSGLPDLPPADSSETYHSLGLSPSGRWAAAWTGSGQQLWDLSRSDTPSRQLEDMGTVLLGDNHLYEISAASVLIHPYDEPQMTERTLICRDIQEVAIDAEEHRLVNLTEEGLEIWDLTKEDQPTLFPQKAERMKLSPDGRKVALWRDGKLVVADLDTQTVLYSLSLTGPFKEASHKK